MALGKLADFVSYLTALPHATGLPRRKDFNKDPDTMLSSATGVRGTGLRTLLRFSKAEISQAVLKFIIDSGYQNSDVGAYADWFRHFNVDWDWAPGEDAEHDVGNKPPNTLSVQYSKPMSRVRKTTYDPATGQLVVYGEAFLKAAMVRVINDGTHVEAAQWDVVSPDANSTFRYASITRQVVLNPGTYFVEITNRLGADYPGGPEVLGEPIVSDTFSVP